MDTQLAQNAAEFDTGQVMKIDSNIGVIEESAGRRRFSLVMNGTLHNYEKRMLCVGRCPYTLPMHFTTIESTERAYYDFTGFHQLEEYIKRNRSNDFQRGDKIKPVCAALELLDKILDSMKGMESYLLFTERFLICPDTIFVTSDGHISIACYTNENPGSELQGRIIELTESLIGLYQDHDAEQYLIKYKEMIRMKNPGLDGMVSILGTLKREASYIYWNTNSFRKEDNTSRPEYDSPVRDPNEKGRTRLGFPLKQDARKIKLIAAQAFLAAGLITVFLTGSIELTSFAGLAVLTAGVDLWLLKKLQFIK